MKRIMFMTAIMTIAMVCRAEKMAVRDVKVTLDPRSAKERIVVNAHFKPIETRKYERIVFECTLRQTLKLPAYDGGKREKVYEPVKFEYCRKNVRMIKQMKKHIHFPVPVGLEELREKYGSLTFKFDDPVTVSHVKIEAYSEGSKVWQIERDVKEPKEKKKSNRSDMMR